MAPLKHLGLSDSDRFSGSPTTSSTTGLRTWNDDGFLILERDDGYFSVRKQPSHSRQHHHGQQQRHHHQHDYDRNAGGGGGRRKSIQQQRHNVKSRSKSNGRYNHSERRGSSSGGQRHHRRDHDDEHYEVDDDDERHRNRPTPRSSSSFNAPKPRRGYQQILDASNTDSSASSSSSASSASPRQYHHNHRRNNKHHHHQHKHRSQSKSRRRSSYHSSSGRSSSRTNSTKREKIDSSKRSLPRGGQGGGGGAPTKLDSSSRHDRGEGSSRDHNNPVEKGGEIDSSNRSASRRHSIRVDGEDAIDSSIRSSSSKHHHRANDGEIDSSTRSTSSRRIEEYDVVLVEDDDVPPEGDEEADYNSSALVLYNPISTATNRYDIPPSSFSPKVVLALDPPPFTSSSMHQHHGTAQRGHACHDNSEPSSKPSCFPSSAEEGPSSTEGGSSNDTDRTVKYDNIKQATITKYKQMYDDMLENQSVFEVVRSSSRRRSSTTTTAAGRSSSTSRHRNSATSKHQHHVGDISDDAVEQHCTLVVRKSVKRTDSKQDSHHGGGGCGQHSRGRRSSNHDSGAGDGGGSERSITKKKSSKEMEHDSPMVQRVSIVSTGSSDNSNQEGTTEDKEPVSIVLDMVDGMEMRREVTFSGEEPGDYASGGIPKLTHSPGSSDDESPKTMELQIIPRVKNHEEDDNDDEHCGRSNRRRCSSGSKYSCSSSNGRRLCSRGRRPSSISRSSQSRNRSSSGGSTRYSSNGSTKDIEMKQSQLQQPKATKGHTFFRIIKNIASKVKNTLTEFGGIHSVQMYSEGETARYKIGKAPKTLVHYDSETKTVEVEIVAVHIDAVLEIPYYTIQLPNKTRKKTSWDNLMTLAEYKKVKSAHVSCTEHNGKADFDGNGELTSRRSRSLSRLRSRLRGSSSQRQHEQDKQRLRSTSRNNRLRSSSNGRDRGDDHSTTSASSRMSPCKSSRSHSSSRRSSSRHHGEHLGRSNTSQRENHGRPRSHSPFQRSIEDGKPKKKEEEDDDRSDHNIRVRRRRSHSSKGRQTSSSRHPTDSLTSIMAVAKDSSSRLGGETIVLGELEATQQQQQQRRRSSNGSPPYIKSCYLVKDGNRKDCKEGEGGAHAVVDNSRQQELNASCGTLIIVEDVTEDSDDEELFSIEK